MPRPDRVRKLLASLVAVAVAAGAMLAPGPRSGLAGLSLDTLFWLRDHAFGRRHPDAGSRVAVVLIDEDTYATPPFRGLSRELWTPYFATVIDAIHAAGPRVVGFDIILPTSLERLLPGFAGYERSFRAALQTAASDGGLVLSKFQGQGPPVVPAREQIMAAGGAANVRAVNMDEDADGIVRRLPLRWRDTRGGSELSFGGELARRAGADPGTGSSMLLNWDGGYPFATYSLADLYACATAGNAAFFDHAFAGRVVLIGTGLDIEDRLLTSRRFINPPERLTGPRCTPRPAALRPPRPLRRVTLPGVFTYATGIDNLLRHETLRALPGPARDAGVAAAAALAAVAAVGLPLAWGAGLLLLLLTAIAAVNTVLLQAGVAAPLLEAVGAALLAFGLMVGFRFTFSDRDRRHIRRVFGLYLAPSVVERLIATGRMPELGGERRDMTFFFSDVAGFTTFAEGADPAMLAPILNAYFDGVCDVILRHGGLVVDFAGDGLHALFGAPVEQPDHARRGIDAARAVAAFVEAFRARQAAAGVPFGHTRIGLHSGPALVGNLGATRRLKYTALGDAVNTAARLEGLNKYFGTRCCVSAATVEAAGERDVRPIGDIVLKGRREPLRVYELLQAGGGDRPEVVRYARAFAALGTDAGHAALGAFATLSEADPQDGCARFWRDRIAAGETSPVVVMADK